MRAYLDSCVVMYAVESHIGFGPRVTALLRQHRDYTFCVSDLVRLECSVLPLRNNDTSLIQEFARFLQTFATLDILPAVYDLAARLRAEHNLRTPDALHYATAMHHGCGEFWTNDTRFSRVTGNVMVRQVK